MSAGGRGVPGGLQGLRQRFECWRKVRKLGARIPDRLWASAVELAGRYGIHRTSEALRLDYYAVKKRVEQQIAAVGLGEGAATQQRLAAPAFVELTSSVAQRRFGPRAIAEPEAAGPWECTVELEDTHGARMRVHLRGVAAPGTIPRMVVAALSRSFWNPGP